MPKLALAVNVPSHAQSSHSSWGMARASHSDEDAWDDDFQTPHTPVRHIIWREDDSHREWMEEWKPQGEVQACELVTR